MDAVTAPKRVWVTRQRLALAAVAAAAAVTGGRAVSLLATKSFAIDEFQYAHAAWLVAMGKLPYRDFFDVHLPLVYQWLALPIAALGADPESIGWLRFAFAPFGVLACFALWKAASSRGAVAGLGALAALLGTPAAVRSLVEIRADVAATAFLLAAVAALDAPTGNARKGFVSGACVGLGCWATQKAWVCAIAFLVCFVLDVGWGQRRGRTAILAHPLAFAAGGASVAALAVSYLALTGSFGAWWRWAIVWALERERLYPGFSFQANVIPHLATAVPLLFLAVAGGARALRSPVEPRGILLLLAVLAAFASALVQVAPYPYAFLPALAFAALLAARALEGWSGLAFLSALVLIGQAALSGLPDNSHQREVLQKLGQLTGPDDVVYDNSGSATARHHVGFFYATDALLRLQLREMLEDEMPERILRSGATVVLRDLRFEGLPQGLQGFLRQHFQPYTPDLWLYGRRLEPGEPTQAFVAPKRGTYFVEPESALAGGRLRVDGRTVTEAVIELERGPHEVQVEGDAGIYLLWLPRNGERWLPAPEGTPSFSQLF